MYSFLYKFFFLFCLFSLSCKGQQGIKHTELPRQYKLLTIAEGQNQICKDSKDSFFNKVGNLDMMLQMNGEHRSESRDSLLTAYQNHLKKSVQSFTNNEAKVVAQTLDSCFSLIHQYLPNLKIPNLEIIKIDPNHYGLSVYYTRENAILVPSNVLSPSSMDALLPVMLHEISHILLRYNDAIKTKTYELIGFKKLDKPLSYSPEILKRILFNPDGLDDRYAITLSDGNTEVLCAPALVSSKSSFSPNISGFMNYIKFDMYRLEEVETSYRLLSNKEGFSTLAPEYMSSFFKQIKDNTQYIIHPDEIIADNFMMYIISSRDETLSNYSNEGEALLHNLAAVLNNLNNQN